MKLQFFLSSILIFPLLASSAFANADDIERLLNINAAVLLITNDCAIVNKNLISAFNISDELRAYDNEEKEKMNDETNSKDKTKNIGKITKIVKNYCTEMKIPMNVCDTFNIKNSEKYTNNNLELFGRIMQFFSGPRFNKQLLNNILKNAHFQSFKQELQRDVDALDSIPYRVDNELYPEQCVDFVEISAVYNADFYTRYHIIRNMYYLVETKQKHIINSKMSATQLKALVENNNIDTIHRCVISVDVIGNSIIDEINLEGQKCAKALKLTNPQFFELLCNGKTPFSCKISKEARLKEKKKKKSIGTGQ